MQFEHPRVRSLGFLVVLVFSLGLVLRLGLIWAWYSDDFVRFQSGDYTLYYVGAEHLRDAGDFSNSLFLVRPPGFVLLVYALGLDHLAVLLANALLGALLAPFTVVLGRLLNLSGRVSMVAGLLVAVDPGSVVYSSFLGPEPLANLFLLIAVVALLWAVTRVKTTRWAVAWGAVAGVALGLSALTRPAAYLLWIVMAGWILIARRERWAAVGSFATCAALLVGGWVWHNARTFDYATFSTIGPYTMTYYRAASVEHLGTGHDMNTVYTAINQRIEDILDRGVTEVGPEAMHGYLAASPEVARALNRVSLDIFKKYPHIYLATFPVGFARMYGIVTTALTDSLPARVVEMAWNTGFTALTAAGLWRLYRQKRWLALWCVILIMGYFTAGNLVMKSAGMTTRERSMLVPFMAVASAVSLVDRRPKADDAVSTIETQQL